MIKRRLLVVARMNGAKHGYLQIKRQAKGQIKIQAKRAEVLNAKAPASE